MTVEHCASSDSIRQQSFSLVNVLQGVYWQSEVQCMLRNGKIKLWTVPDPPEPLAYLLTDLSTRSAMTSDATIACCA